MHVLFKSEEAHRTSLITEPNEPAGFFLLTPGMDRFPSRLLRSGHGLEFSLAPANRKGYEMANFDVFWAAVPSCLDGSPALTCAGHPMQEWSRLADVSCHRWYEKVLDVDSRPVRTFLDDALISTDQKRGAMQSLWWGNEQRNVAAPFVNVQHMILSPSEL